MNNSKNIYYEVRVLNRYMRRLSHGHDSESEANLSHSQLNYLNLLLSNSGISQRELGEMLRIRPSSMTESTNKLESLGLLKKVKDENDKRITRLYITSHAEKLMNDSMKENEKFESTFFEMLNDDEQVQLLTLLKKANDSLKE